MFVTGGSYHVGRCVGRLISGIGYGTLNPIFHQEVVKI